VGETRVGGRWRGWIAWTSLRLGGEALGGLAAWASPRRACRRRGRGPPVATWDGAAWRGASLSQ
jgi:hypothetical protein